MHPYTTHPDLIEHPLRLHRLQKHILNYLAIDRKHLAPQEIFRQERSIRDRIWSDGGTAWLRVTSEILNRPLVRTMDGHPAENRKTRRAAAKMAAEAAAQAEAEARNRAIARADQREKERGNSSDPEVRKDWVRDHSHSRPEDIPATADQPKPLWKTEPGGIAPPKAARPSTFAAAQTARRQYVIPDPVEIPAAAAEAQKRAERALARDLKADPTERASEHSRSFPMDYVRKILSGEVPMPSPDAPNRELVEGWIATEIDRALNPFGHRDRTHAVLPEPIAKAVEAATVPATAIEAELKSKVEARQKGR